MEVPSIFLNRLLSETAKKGASSLHFTVGSVPFIRVDGRLVLMEKEDIITVDFVNEIINSFISDEESLKLKKNRKLLLAKTFANNFRFRISVFYQKNVPSISFNLISGVVKDIKDFDLPKSIIDATKLKSGLLIIAGPDNSGKTSTAAAFIEEINKNQNYLIFTLEDPIEYVFVNKKSVVEQRQLGQDVKDYLDGLKHCLNEDVDVLYIDEIKDNFEKTVPYILELASGNSLVILEMNADTSSRALERFLDVNKKTRSIEALQYNLADVLVGVIAHRLVPAIGGGMALAKEILVATPPVKNLIKEGKIYQLESIIQTSRDEGMVSLAKSLNNLIREGKVSKEDVDKLNI